MAGDARNPQMAVTEPPPVQIEIIAGIEWKLTFKSWELARFLWEKSG